MEAIEGKDHLSDDHYVARVIYRWLFSWAQPGYCITEEEYELSKAILLVFVQCPTVKHTLSLSQPDQLVKFIR